MRPLARGNGRPAAWKTMLWLLGIGLALGLAGAGAIVATASGYVPHPVDLPIAEAEATYAACQDFVRPQLTAAGPATFPAIGRRTVRRYLDGRFSVRSHADARNAAGRLVEFRFACTLRPLGGGRWHLERLSVSTD